MRVKRVARKHLRFVMKYDSNYIEQKSKKFRSRLTKVIMNYRRRSRRLREKSEVRSRLSFPHDSNDRYRFSI